MTDAPRPLALALYAAATRLVEPVAPALLRRRAGAGKEDPARLGERLGRAVRARPDGPLAWLHAVSVGESLSLLPLIEALRARRPDLQILVTSVTRTSAEVLASRLPAGVIHQFAPVDAPGAARRFLRHWRPGLAIFTESELWPNLILESKAAGARLALLSARMRADSAAGWMRAPASAARLLQAFDLVLPQEAQSAERLQALGARPGPMLNLKLVGAAPPFDPTEFARLRHHIGDRKVVLAASTHPGEEALVTGSLGELPDAPLLILAPRHPERAEALLSELCAAGEPPPRRSLGKLPGPGVRVYLADSLGEMGLFLRLADVVVMGGSFVSGIGGHNPLEAARLAKPVVTGPEVFNARAVYDDLIAQGGVIEAADGAALGRHVSGLLAYPHIARRVGEAALSYAERQGDALDTALDALTPLLPA